MPPDLTAGLVIAFVLTTWRHTLLGRAAGYLVVIVFVNRYAMVGWGRAASIRYAASLSDSSSRVADPPRTNASTDHL